MKFLKGLLIAVLSLVVIYFILALFAPSNYKVTRTMDINAPATIVFDQISNFQNWEKWSPWAEKDSSVKNTYEGDMGKVNSKMSWVGNEELSGTGSMTISGLEMNKSVNYDLAFEIPYEMSSKGGMILEEKEGKTSMTWYDEGDIPFLMRPMMLFMDLDAQIGPDFERGMTRIDSVAQLVVKMNTPKPIEITETTFPARKYLGIRNNTTIQSVMQSSFYEENFKKLGMYMGKYNLVMTEGTAPSSFFMNWNEKDSTCTAIPSFALNGITKANEAGYEVIDIPSQLVVMAKYYGPYQGAYGAYAKLDDYIKQKGWELDYVLEEYMNDPIEVEEKDILTHIIYFLKKKETM